MTREEVRECRRLLEIHGDVTVVDTTSPNQYGARFLVEFLDWNNLPLRKWLKFASIEDANGAFLV